MPFIPLLLLSHTKWLVKISRQLRVAPQVLPQMDLLLVVPQDPLQVGRMQELRRQEAILSKTPPIQITPKPHMQARENQQNRKGIQKREIQ